jgi:hypothetical protein
VLGQAAHIAKRNPEFTATYQAITKRRGKQIATTAVARKLLTRAYHLLAEDAEAGKTIDETTRVSRTPRTRTQTGEGHQTPGALAPAA